MNNDLSYYGNPMNWESTKGNKLNEAIKTIRELCEAKEICRECPMNWNCGEYPEAWEEVRGGSDNEHL